jgi:hypothetical protein
MITYLAPMRELAKEFNWQVSCEPTTHRLVRKVVLPPL